VPAAKRLRAAKTGPALGREQPAGRREQGSVDARVLRPFPSALENRQLVAQDDDFELPLTASTGEHANEATQEPVQHARQHDMQV
jgi:hypothetical protein